MYTSVYIYAYYNIYICLKLILLLKKRLSCEMGTLQVPAAPAPAPPSPPPAPPAPAAIDKERVTAKFKELVAGGVDPNDAATQAIQMVRREMATATAPPGALEVRGMKKEESKTH